MEVCMKKFQVQMKIEITVTREVRAENLEHAIAQGSDLQTNQLIRTLKGVEWQWDEVMVTGVYE
jgi:hypothetical protein